MSSAIDTVARRFLHDFTADISRSTLHEADQAAWWAGSLRGSSKPPTSAAAAAAAAAAADTGALVVAAAPEEVAHRPPLSSRATNNTSSGGGYASRRSASSPQQKQHVPAALDQQQEQQQQQQLAAVPPRRSTTPSAAVVRAAEIADMRRRNPEAGARIEQFAAQVHGACGSKLTPVVTPHCAAPRWDPDTRVVPTSDPLYALLHRRLEEEGFLADYAGAEQRFRQRVTKREASARSADSARRDRELEWYVDVYRPKQRRQALLDVEGDARREVAEEELAARMRLKHRVGEALYALQLAQRRATEKQRQQEREAQRRREEEERHLQEWLVQHQRHLVAYEEQRRREIRREHAALQLNLYTQAETERERLVRARLSAVTRLKNELAAMLSSEGSRRGSIVALEATCRDHMRQQLRTERAELHCRLRAEVLNGAMRARRESAHAEADERAALWQRFAAQQEALMRAEALLRDEGHGRRCIAHEEDQGLQRAVFEWTRAANTIVELTYASSLELVADEAALGRVEIAEAEAASRAAIRGLAQSAVQAAFAARAEQLLQAEATRRDELRAAFHDFVVNVARCERAAVNVMAEETAARHELVAAASADLHALIRRSLFESLVLREAGERAAIARDEDVCGAGRHAVEASVLRDALAASRKAWLARQLHAVEQREQEVRHRFVADAIDGVAGAIADARRAIAEAQRASEAKLLQLALKLQTNFVGIGLAERGEFLQVESLVVDGPGMRAGLRLGDMVLQIGGIPVATTLEMRSALKRSGFVSKNIDVVIRRFVPAGATAAAAASDSGNGGAARVSATGVDHIVVQQAPVVPTVRPEGSFEEKPVTVQLLVSTTDERFKQFPFWFDAAKTQRICLPLQK